MYMYIYFFFLFSQVFNLIQLVTPSAQQLHKIEILFSVHFLLYFLMYNFVFVARVNCAVHMLQLVVHVT